MVGRGNGCEPKGNDKALALTEACFESSFMSVSGVNAELMVTESKVESGIINESAGRYVEKHVGIVNGKYFIMYSGYCSSVVRQVISSERVSPM